MRVPLQNATIPDGKPDVVRGANNQKSADLRKQVQDVNHSLSWLLRLEPAISSDGVLGRGKVTAFQRVAPAVATATVLTSILIVIDASFRAGPARCRVLWSGAATRSLGN